MGWFFGFDIAQAISNAIGSIIMVLASSITIAVAGTTVLLLKLIAVVFGLVFHLAYMFLTATIVLDFGRLLGMQSFPDPNTLKPSADYWHIYMIISDNNDFATVLGSANKTTVVLLPEIFGIAKGLFNSLMVLIAVVMIMRVMYEYLKIEPRDVYQDVELLSRKAIEIIFGLVVIMVFIPGVLGLVSILPVKVGDYAWNTMAMVKDAEGNTRNVVDYSVNAIADLYIYGIKDLVGAITKMVTFQSGVDLGTAVGYSILLPLFAVGVAFVISATLIAILVAPISMLVKRIILSFFTLVMYPVYLLITYAGEMLQIAGRGIGNFGGGILDNVLSEFASAINSFSELMTMYIRHMIGTAIGIPIFLFALRLTGDIAVAFQHGEFVNSMVSYGEKVASGQASLIAVYMGVSAPVAVSDNTTIIKVPETAQDLLARALIKFMVAFSMFVVVAMLFSKLEQIDQPGSILEFGRLQQTVTEGLMAGLSLSLAGLALPLAGAGAVIGKAVGVAGTRLALAGFRRLGYGVAGLGHKMAVASTALPLLMLGRGAPAGIPSVSGAKTMETMPGEQTATETAMAPATLKETETAREETTEKTEETPELGTVMKSLFGTGARTSYRMNVFSDIMSVIGANANNVMGVSGRIRRIGRERVLPALMPVKRTAQVVGSIYGSVMLAGTGMALSQMARVFLGDNVAEKVREVTGKYTEKLLNRGVMGGLDMTRKRLEVAGMFREKGLINRRLVKKLRLGEKVPVDKISDYNVIRRLDRVTGRILDRHRPVVEALVKSGVLPSEVLAGIKTGGKTVIARIRKVLGEEHLDKLSEFLAEHKSAVKAVSRELGVSEETAEKIIMTAVFAKLHGSDAREVLREYATHGHVPKAIYSTYMKKLSMT